MQAFIARQFAKSKAVPNTFIGGIAKQGGTGVNAPIDTPYKLSQKLGIAVNRITGFKVIGDDLECRIRGSYIVSTGFGGTVSADANKNIKSFIDEDGLITSISVTFLQYTTVINVKLPSITIIPQTAFRGTFSLVNLDAPLVTTVQSTAFQNDSEFLTFNAKPVTIANVAFQGCTKLNLDTSELTTLTGAGNHFRNMRQVIFNLNKLTSTQGLMFSFRDNPQMQELHMPLLVNLLSSTSQPCNEAFLFNTSMNLFDAKKLKTIGLANEQKNLFVGVFGITIKVHVFMATSNAGTADLDLIHAKSLGNTVEFYDDNGDYVSTL